MTQHGEPGSDMVAEVNKFFCLGSKNVRQAACLWRNHDPLRAQRQRCALTDTLDIDLVGMDNTAAIDIDLDAIAQIFGTTPRKRLFSPIKLAQKAFSGFS